MSVTDSKAPELRWEIPVGEPGFVVLATPQVVACVEQLEQFVSVGTAPQRTLTSAIVHDFAEDLRRLADA
jgi:hypothetical protein